MVDSSGEGAKNGAYVTYNVDAMIAILTIEASRADGLVIGEDLGTVPNYVRKVLASHGVLGTVVEWFARVDDSPNAGDPYDDPTNYRKYALASVTTHDLPPTQGTCSSSMYSCVSGSICLPNRWNPSKHRPPRNVRPCSIVCGHLV